MKRIDAPGHVNNRFHDGNPTLGMQGTILSADWLNTVQEELAGTIEKSGMVLDKYDNNQLYEAINKLAKNQFNESLAIKDKPLSIKVNTDLIESDLTTSLINTTEIIEVRYALSVTSNISAGLGISVYLNNKEILTESYLLPKDRPIRIRLTDIIKVEKGTNKLSLRWTADADGDDNIVKVSNRYLYLREVKT